MAEIFKKLEALKNPTPQFMGEGKLKYGDTVTHSNKPGKYMLQRICKDGSIIVSQGLDVEKWKLDSSSLVREVK